MHMYITEITLSVMTQVRGIFRVWMVCIFLDHCPHTCPANSNQDRTRTHLLCSRQVFVTYLTTFNGALQAYNSALLHTKPVIIHAYRPVSATYTTSLKAMP